MSVMWILLFALVGLFLLVDYERHGPDEQAVIPPTVTAPAAIPSATPGPSPTAHPNDTPSDTILSLGETWRSQGIELTLTQCHDSLVGIRVVFLLANYTRHHLPVRFHRDDPHTIQATDSLGRRYAYQQHALVEPPSWEAILAPNQELEIEVTLRPSGDYDISDEGVESLIVVISLGSLDGARWHIPWNAW
jgi:hypothetical protein